MLFFEVYGFKCKQHARPMPVFCLPELQGARQVRTGGIASCLAQG